MQMVSKISQSMFTCSFLQFAYSVLEQVEAFAAHPPRFVLAE